MSVVPKWKIENTLLNWETATASFGFRKVTVPARCGIVGVVTHFPKPHARRRAERIEMSKPVNAIVVQEDGQHTNCRLQTVSVTGGLLLVGEPISQGDFVELAFQANSGTVHGMAEMLSPLCQSDHLSQPFRFIALDDEDHRALRVLADVANDQKTFLSSSALRRL